MKRWDTNHVEAIKSIMKKLSRSKDRKKSAIERRMEKDLWRFCRRQQDGSMDSIIQRANYILQKTIRMQTEACTLLNGGRQLYALIHEARILRELILWSIEDDEVYIHGSSHEKQHVFSLNLEEVFFKRILKVSLVVHPDPWSYDERKKWNL